MLSNRVTSQGTRKNTKKSPRQRVLFSPRKRSQQGAPESSRGTPKCSTRQTVHGLLVTFLTYRLQQFFRIAIRKRLANSLWSMDGHLDLDILGKLGEFVLGQRRQFTP